jgi:amicyanin
LRIEETKIMKRAFYVVSIAVILAMILARLTTLGATTDAKVAGAEVKIDNFSFAPAVLTVPVGTQVTWTNRDDIPHNVVTDDAAIKSKVLDTDEKFSFTFSKPGTYSYFCSIHPKMKGTVVVR